MKENKFQADLKIELKSSFPGCIVTKLDSADIQGIPDLLVLYKDKWAALEVKKSATASHRPNQDYYVEKMDNMSFSKFIYPENKRLNLRKNLKSYSTNIEFNKNKLEPNAV